MAAGDFDSLFKSLKDVYPELFYQPPRVTQLTTWPATMLAFAYQQTGNETSKLAVLDAMEKAISGVDIIRGPGFMNGIEDVEIIVDKAPIRGVQGDIPQKRV